MCLSLLWFSFHRIQSRRSGPVAIDAVCKIAVRRKSRGRLSAILEASNRCVCRLKFELRSWRLRGPSRSKNSWSLVEVGATSPPVVPATIAREIAGIEWESRERLREKSPKNCAENRAIPPATRSRFSSASMQHRPADQIVILVGIGAASSNFPPRAPLLRPAAWRRHQLQKI